MPAEATPAGWYSAPRSIPELPGTLPWVRTCVVFHVASQGNHGAIRSAVSHLMQRLVIRDGREQVHTIYATRDGYPGLGSPVIFLSQILEAAIH